MTWRYIDSRSDPGNKAALSRRTLVSEEWLSRTVTALNDKFQEGLDESVKKQLNERRVKELVELMMPPSRDLSEAEKQGRKTGSLQVGRDKQCPLDIATLDIAAALAIATSNPVTEAGRYIQCALSILMVVLLFLGICFW